MDQARLNQLLTDLFQAPTNLTPDADLREYILDSIDAGELVAELNDQLQLELHITDLQGITTFSQLQALIQTKHS